MGATNNPTDVNFATVTWQTGKYLLNYGIKDGKSRLEAASPFLEIIKSSSASVRSFFNTASDFEEEQSTLE